MLVEDQRSVIDFLMQPSTHGGVAVERIDTHSAVVFLAGPRALKLKRAVRFDYLDFSTVEHRHAACEAELRINRRTAPSVYHGVLPVVRRGDGSLALGGDGTPVDWLVDMVRFDQDFLFDRLAARASLGLELMQPLGSSVARFHATAERRPAFGGREGMTWVVDGNQAGFVEHGAGALDGRGCEELTESSLREIARWGSLLERRRADGYVRQCHGDLHLRNIVLLDGQPTLFDAIEFNDQLACVDVLYDFAFLLMDLWRRRLPRHANAAFNGYLADAGDLDGLALLPLFLSCRAAVRAKTSATAARLQGTAERTRELQDLAREYVAMARDLLRAAPARLIAIGGLSGSGKSTLAQSLAPEVGAVPGAVVLRSDEIRKAVCGVPRLQRLGDEGYARDVTTRVYRTLVDRARRALAAGHSVIADAVFARPADRAAIEAVAASERVPFTGLWLDAPSHVLVTRVDQRSLDASDANATVVRQQLATDLGAIHWLRIDAAAAPRDVLNDVRSRIGASWRRVA
jgi:hypothetical protein